MNSLPLDLAALAGPRRARAPVAGPAPGPACGLAPSDASGRAGASAAATAPASIPAARAGDPALLPPAALAAVHYAERDADSPFPRLRDLWRWLRGAASPPRPAQWPARFQRAFASASRHFAGLDDQTLAAALPTLRARLRADDPRGTAAARSLALAADAARRHLRQTPYPTQCLAAWLMLDGRLAEMATGEGKTLATGLAAAAAALTGTPVHVLTANDYLVQRDRETLAPMFDALGLGSASVLPAMSRDERTAAYAHDIVYLTARELGFDYLRDHLALRGQRDPRLLAAREIGATEAAACATGGPSGGAIAAAATAPRPALPGLRLALVDEADSILLDEATMPLIVAMPVGAIDADGYRRALAVSRRLQRGADYRLLPAQRRAELTEAGRDAVARALADAGGCLRPLRRAQELVEAALSARLVMQRDRDYAVVEGRLQHIDEVTGRIADGRQWTGPLQAMVELKEGLEPSVPTQPAAQITYQRFFPRYLRLGGMSGTLAEARLELGVLYGPRVARVPLARPDRRRWLGERGFADTPARDAALVARVVALRAVGRPVLVGTDSVAASQRVSQRLHAAGVPHELLNAVQDGAEAERIARAGSAGAVTVATNIAGRGTDIRLDDAARAAGGLHVIATMRNRSRRIDRQLVGRAARHGDPGSAERLLALDDPLLTAHWPRWLRAAAARGARGAELPRLLTRLLATGAQQRAEAHDRALRRRLRLVDRHQAEAWAFAGGTE